MRVEPILTVCCYFNISALGFWCQVIFHRPQRSPIELRKRPLCLPIPSVFHIQESFRITSAGVEPVGRGIKPCLLSGNPVPHNQQLAVHFTPFTTASVILDSYITEFNRDLYPRMGSALWLRSTNYFNNHVLTLFHAALELPLGSLHIYYTTNFIKSTHGLTIIVCIHCTRHYQLV